MTKRWGLLIGIFTIAFLVFALSTMPLGFVISSSGLTKSGLSFQRAEGDVWRGALIGASWRERQLGDVYLSIRPLSLLLARLKLDFRFDGDGVIGRGILAAGLGGSVSLEKSAFRAELERFEFNEPAPLSVHGIFIADMDLFVLSKNGCRSAEGLVWTDILEHSVRALDYQGPPLSGRVHCEDGRLVIPFAGADDDEDIALTLTVNPDFSYQLAAEVRTDDERLDQVLPAFGFAANEGVYRYERSGQAAFGRPNL